VKKFWKKFCADAMNYFLLRVKGLMKICS
jgi:hypothetical protein